MREARSVICLAAMRTAFILSLALFVSGCASEGDGAAERYENAKSAGGSASALCDRANEAIRIYLDEGNQKQVDKYAALARHDCHQDDLVKILNN